MRFFWKAYAILFIFITTGNILYFLKNDSSIRMYYMTMISFFPSYLFYFSLNALNLLVTLLISIIVICYAFNVRIGLKLACWLFFVRILTEVLGHHYEWKFIQSTFTDGPRFGFIAVCSIFVPLIPSYIAHYRYISRRKE